MQFVKLKWSTNYWLESTHNKILLAEAPWVLVNKMLGKNHAK